MGRPKGSPNRDKREFEVVLQRELRRHKKLTGEDMNPTRVLVSLMGEKMDPAIRLRAAQHLHNVEHPKPATFHAAVVSDGPMVLSWLDPEPPPTGNIYDVESELLESPEAVELDRPATSRHRRPT